MMHQTKKSGNKKRVPIAIFTSESARGNQITVDEYPESLVFNRKPIEITGPNSFNFLNISPSRNLLSELLRTISPAIRDLVFYSTSGTAQQIFKYCPTEVESDLQLRSFLPGNYGGLVQLAAICVRSQVRAVIILSDPTNPGSDSPENRAVHRICIHKQIPILNSVRSATEWMREALPIALKQEEISDSKNKSVEYSQEIPTNFEMRAKRIPSGVRHNPNITMDLEAQTLALIAHDTKKIELIQFADRNMVLVERFHRILATGTTGWLIKVLFAPSDMRSEVLGEARKTLGPSRASALVDKASTIQRELWLSGFPMPRPNLVRKIYPQPSGPEGGDILVAEEVLRGTCDYVVFFQDPLQAHPHEPDIRLLRRTCQLPGTYSVCISSENAAYEWASRKNV